MRKFLSPHVRRVSSQLGEAVFSNIFRRQGTVAAPSRREDGPEGGTLPQYDEQGGASPMIPADILHRLEKALAHWDGPRTSPDSDVEIGAEMAEAIQQLLVWDEDNQSEE